MGQFYHHESLCEALIHRPFRYLAVAAIAYTLGHVGGCNSKSTESDFVEGMKERDRFQLMYQVQGDQAESFLVYQRASFPVPMDQAKEKSVPKLHKEFVMPHLEK